jgi:transketolase N-terminal domain/subunit
MPDETIETIRTLLESALDDVDDTDVSYRLRTALQLLDFQQNQIDRLTTAAEQDEELQERLDALGYLE